MSHFIDKELAFINDKWYVVMLGDEWQGGYLYSSLSDFKRQSLNHYAVLPHSPLFYRLVAEDILLCRGQNKELTKTTM